MGRNEGADWFGYGVDVDFVGNDACVGLVGYGVDCGGGVDRVENKVDGYVDDAGWFWLDVVPD